MANKRLTAALKVPMNLGSEASIEVKIDAKKATHHLPDHTPTTNWHDELCDRWLAELTMQHYSPATITAYYQAIKHFCQFLASLPSQNLPNPNNPVAAWQKLTRQHIADYLGKRIDVDKLAVVSVQHELTVLRQFFSWLITQNVLETNPTTAIRLKRPPRPLPTLIDGDVMSQLLDQPAPDNASEARLWLRDKAMLELLYGSGLRVSELIGLDLADIDSSQRLIRVTGKGNKTRIVPMGGQAWQALQNYLPHRHLWAEEESSEKGTVNNAVFISERLGTRLTTRSVQLRIKVQAQRAGIAQDLYPHLLRHCFASDILSGSGDLRGVQELLGHSDISTTQIYTHLDFGHLAKVYDKAHPRAKK